METMLDMKPCMSIMTRMIWGKGLLKINAMLRKQ